VAALRELWADREMVRSLAEREMRARYKQTYLGIAWAVITPFLLMIVFTLFFKNAANVKTGPAPYPLVTYLGLLPWGFFSTSIAQGGVTLVTNVSLLNKVYCPREVFPLASVCLAAIDTLIAFSALVVIFVVEGYVPHAEAYYVPLFLAVAVAFTVGSVLIVSSVVVYLRDLRTTLPLLLQLGLFATPVAYDVDAIPARFRPLYAATNPLVSVIDGLRRTVLYGQQPRWGLFTLSAVSAAVVLAFGYWLFKRLEGGIADVA
jgi:ABC-2 type transport system permease protein/lipopolysaccharide transport system permease protein